MSLINQMLQDLDQRRSGEVTSQGSLESDVRAVASTTKSTIPLWSALTLILLLVVGLLLWLLQRYSGNAVQQPAAIAAAPAPLPALAPSLKADMRLDWQGGVHVVSRPELPVSVPAETSVAAPVTVDAKPVETLVANHAEAHKAMPVARPGAVEKREKEPSPQQRAENTYRHAISLLQQGRVIEAIDSLQQAIKLDPQHLSARQTLAALLVEAKRPAEAEQVLQEGLELSPQQSGFAMVLARLQAGRGDAAAALDTLHNGLPYAADKADYRALYAALLQRQEKHAEAIEQYQAALRKTPGSGVWLMGLGISLQAEKRSKEAEDAFNRAKASGSLSPDLKAFVEQRLKQLQ